VEKEELLKEITAQVKKIVAESQKESVTPEVLEARIKEVNENAAKLDNEGVKELKAIMDGLSKKMEGLEDISEIVKTQGETIKMLAEKGIGSGGSKPKTWREAMKAAFMEKADKVLVKKNDDRGERYSLKDYFTEKGNQQTPVFTIKSAVDMLQSAIVQNYVGQTRLTDLDPQRVGIPLNLYPTVLDYMPQRSISGPNMALLVAYSFEDGAATKTEGSASAKSSLLFKTVSFPAFYIATYATLSDETLDDLEEALDELSIVIPDAIRQKIDGYVLGAAGNDTSAIAGILSANKHTAFSAATYANTVAGANIIDVIAKMKMAAHANKQKPNAVILNPTEIDNIAALKNAIEDSVSDRRVTWDSLGMPSSIYGLRVIASTSIDANKAIVLDVLKARIGKRNEMTMEIGYNGTDLTEGQKTVVFKMRVAFGVADKTAVIYCADIATDTGTINKGA
jgi:HK97 family phage major capsid protein